MKICTHALSSLLVEFRADAAHVIGSTPLIPRSQVGRELERTLWAVGRLTLSPDADGLRAVSEHVIELAMRYGSNALMNLAVTGDELAKVEMIAANGDDVSGGGVRC